MILQCLALGFVDTRYHIRGHYSVLLCSMVAYKSRDPGFEPQKEQGLEKKQVNNWPLPTGWYLKVSLLPAVSAKTEGFMIDNSIIDIIGFGASKHWENGKSVINLTQP